jgi:hypothetical protein
MEITAKYRNNRSFLVILSVFAVLAACYSFADRLKWGPDEPAHFIYIRSMATDFKPPPISHTGSHSDDFISSHEGHQPPLYYALMAIPYTALKAAGMSNDGIWRALRLLNIPLGMIWICLVYTLAHVFFRDNRYAQVTTAFVALIPTAPYMAGVINNENLISLIFTWSLVPMLNFLRSGKLTPKQAIFSGLLIGLAMLTKAQGLVLLPLFLIASFAVCRRNRYKNLLEVLRTNMLVIGTTAFVSGWWFVRSWFVYGTPMPHSFYRPMLESDLVNLVFLPFGGLNLIAACTRGLYGYFWTPFWLVWPFMSFRVYFYLLSAITVPVIVGLAIRLWRNGNIDYRSLAFLTTAPILTWALLIIYILKVDSGTNLQGRLFLSSAGVIGILWVLGFDGLLKSERAKRIGTIVGLGLMLLANFAVIGCAIALYHT